MKNTTQFSSTLEMPLERITGVWRFERRPGAVSVATTPPGHLLHYIVEGEYELSWQKFNWNILSGDVIQYGSCEEVRSRFTSELVFYSVAFDAPAWEAPEPAERVLRGLTECGGWFAALETAFRHGDRWEAGLAMLQILRTVQQARRAVAAAPVPGVERWRRVLQYVKRKRMFHPDTAWLCRRFHTSPATLLRDCRAATGMTPMHCFKLWRLEEARALLRLSDCNVSEVAAALGYRRIHEFSREFSAFFGYSPRVEKQRRS